MHGMCGCVLCRGECGKMQKVSLEGWWCQKVWECGIVMGCVYIVVGYGQVLVVGVGI